MTDSRIHPGAQRLADRLLEACGGDQELVCEHIRVARVLADFREPFEWADDVLRLFQKPVAPPADTFPGADLDQFIRDALAILDPGPVTIKPELRLQILEMILKLIRGEVKPRSPRPAAPTDEHTELIALLKFKSFVHRRLDEYQVPSDPFPEENAKHGCRISGRLQWLNERRMTLEHAEVITRFLVAPVGGAGLTALRDALVALQRCAEILP